MRDSDFDSNVAGEQGGGIWNGSLANPVVTGCVVRKNHAVAGGGMFTNFGSGDPHVGRLGALEQPPDAGDDICD